MVNNTDAVQWALEFYGFRNVDFKVSTNPCHMLAPQSCDFDFTLCSLVCCLISTPSLTRLVVSGCLAAARTPVLVSST